MGIFPREKFFFKLLGNFDEGAILDIEASRKTTMEIIEGLLARKPMDSVIKFYLQDDRSSG